MESTDLVTAVYPISDQASTGMWALFAGVWVVLLIVGIISLILWIWAIIDCAKRQFPGSGKTTWIIVLIVGLVIGLGWLVAIIYLIVGKKQGTIPGSVEKPKEAIKESAK